ncbi:unnamed protein product [Euphydryas editha]|uniref:Uncharacterized protein n=1 Tax=Euphydryas editha TaxID=104508 RepID=A0AAU9VE38_EUPED|nr:unnamed protein product [Euphydryas editha]
MYRQIEIDNSQRHLQLILWREDKEQPLKILKLNTVTYGTASAPHLATRLCLLQLSQECNDETIANVIKRDFYMDDLNTDIPVDNVITKRTVTSMTCKIFDPLGLLSASIIKSKIFLQQLWSNKMDWDQPLPSDEASKWTVFIENLAQLSSIVIPRIRKIFSI